MIDALAGFLPRCRRVLESWKLYQRNLKRERPRGFQPRPDSYRELPNNVREYKELWLHKELRRKALPKSERYFFSLFDARDDVIFEVRRWREALDDTRLTIPSAHRCMDDRRLPPVQRWTGQLQGVLGELGGMIDRNAVGDLPQTLDTGKFERVAVSLYRFLNELKHVPDIPKARRRNRLKRGASVAQIAAEIAQLKSIQEATLRGIAQIGQPDPTRSRAQAAGESPKRVEPELVVQRVDAALAEPPVPGPTTFDLAAEAGVSNDTLRRIRVAARIEVKLRGGAARNRRYSPSEVDRLIAAALAGTFLERRRIAEKWARWGSK